MNGVQLYTIIHFGRDIVHPKIGSIITYVEGSTKLTSLRAHLSYEDFVALLEETSEIRCEDCKELSTTKDTGSGRGLSTTKARGPLRHNSFPDPKPKYKGYPEINSRGLDPRSIHLSNEPVLTNVPPSNKHMLTNVPLSIEPEPFIGQTETSAEFRFEPQLEQVKNLIDFWFKSATYTEDPYDFIKEFNIGNLYRDRIELKNYLRAYAVVNKFNLEHVLSNEYKIVVHCKGHKCSWRIYTTRCEAALSTHNNYLRAILRKRDTESLTQIMSRVRITEEAEKIQARLTPWVTDHCESRKFVADSLTCRVRTSRHHFQMISYGRTDSVYIEDGSCSCRWWQMMGIPCEHGVRALGLANVDPTTRVSEYFTNNTYKAVYEPIWIPIR
ncbi:hypothetical protein GIB67_008150 [Kingdonia uniflora]|uniref:SWIM-type domain-containing protein n=1 Tax=Kingdonia uniflora TaxID=39325 RepID=A0A7J7MSX9_9MAGN|nr:hypothetical protein GIB67_008150 [Kingdonia uniflora]